ncbi:type ISP restriction/modification enzyme [Streptomyces sp. CAU 1734]|uniref:type ISP restriction/modification enzyme n=1 Tax=Streptomyces sp. CAU 1734 TaxID=3140360 RepID=UPI0032616C84
MPMLDELMPWGVPPLRLGRSWVMGPDPASLTARWDAVTRARGPERDALFGCTRARTPLSAVGQLPGQRTGTGRFAREPGNPPAPVPILHGAFDRQWILPDHRLIDAARPELWRVADEHQIFLVEQPPGSSGPAVIVSALLPDGHTPSGRAGAIRPFFRGPGGTEPNLAPGLPAALAGRYGLAVTPADVFAWIAAAAAHGPAGCAVALPADPGVWRAGVALGRRLLTVQLRGAHGGDRPRLPPGRRPYVRTALPARPAALSHDPATGTLSAGEGRVSPVPAAAWEFRSGGEGVLERWFGERTAAAEPGTLAALGPARWPREWTSELLELITVLALLAETPAGSVLPPGTEVITDLPGVLPPPGWTRRPASVLGGAEEGPEGQFALL